MQFLKETEDKSRTLWMMASIHEMQSLQKCYPMRKSMLSKLPVNEASRDLGLVFLRLLSHPGIKCETGNADGMRAEPGWIGVVRSHRVMKRSR